MTKILNKKILVKGKILLKTGLHIGGTNDTMDIGGIDNAIIRNPVDKKPYIPGSSLKGKMRALLSLTHNLVIPNPRNHRHIQYVDSSENHEVTRLMGTAKNDNTQRPAQLIVRDCILLDESLDILKDTDLLYSEIKTETVIDRVTSKADPRPLERVPAGAKFNLSLVVSIFELEDEESTLVELKKLMKTLFEGLHLIQDDYLGGGGSRGNGNVSFIITEIRERNKKFYLGESNGEKNYKSESELQGFGVPQELLTE